VSGPNNIARKEAALIAGQLPQWLTQRVTAIRGYSRDDVRLTLENADVIRWGSSENFKSKIEVIEVLLDLEARIYDVSAPSMPVTRS
jgi:cell division protein FtsQ